MLCCSEQNQFRLLQGWVPWLPHQLQYSQGKRLSWVFFDSPAQLFMCNSQQDIHTTERCRSTCKSGASSRLCKRPHLIAFLSNILFKYLQIVYDINPLVLGILEVYLDSHRKFSPASPGQVKWRFSGNKWWFTFWMQKWYSFHLPFSESQRLLF